MNFKAIVLDMDGTLLNKKQEITNSTKEILIRIQEMGIKLILASGRTTVAMMNYAHALKMDKYNGLLVSYNGAKVVDVKTRKELFDKSMSLDEGKALLEHLKKFDLKVMIDKEDYMYVNDVYDCFIKYKNEDFNIIEYEARGGNFKLCEEDDLAGFLDYPISKILTAASPEYLQENYKKIEKPFKDSLNAMFTADFYFEFTAKGIDKGKALKKVLPLMNINREDILAFGDGHNDISLLKYAGFGIAMENAVDELKNIADMVTLSNEDDGILAALTKIGLA